MRYEHLVLLFPGRRVRPRNGRFRVIAVILWKQYSCRKAQKVGRNPPEEKPKTFRSEYCFHVPAISGAFLQDTVTIPHLSCRILWPESSTWVAKAKRF